MYKIAEALNIKRQLCAATMSMHVINRYSNKSYDFMACYKRCAYNCTSVVIVGSDRKHILKYGQLLCNSLLIKYRNVLWKKENMFLYLLIDNIVFSKQMIFIFYLPGNPYIFRD